MILEFDLNRDCNSQLEVTATVSAAPLKAQAAGELDGLLDARAPTTPPSHQKISVSGTNRRTLRHGTWLSRYAAR